jgi:hypothetical protein
MLASTALTIEMAISWDSRSKEMDYMEHIVVSDEQARLICEATESVEIRDAKGAHLGYVAHGFTDEDIAVAKQRKASNEPRYTTEQVLERPRSLDQK